MAGSDPLEIAILGELHVTRSGQEIPLPASKKARALLGFLAATGRPHRRERLCELLWDMPDDPKAALRWALTKIRKAVDTEGQPRITADRERVALEIGDVSVDFRDMRNRLKAEEPGSLVDLEDAARRLDHRLLDGLDGAGDESFDAWLAAEREDAAIVRIEVLRRLAQHPDASTAQRAKWARLWEEADPEAAVRLADPALAQTARSEVPRLPGHREHLRDQRIGFCKVRDGTKIAYATLGVGPPLVKAANWLTHIEHDWNTPIWGACFADIARDRTLVRYDERGCGLSDWDVRDLSFDAFVEDLEAVADRLELRRFPLLGISQGAAVSIEYAVRHPERVSGLILIGAYASGWRHHATEEEQSRRVAVRELTELGWGTDNPAYRHIFTQTFMPDADPDELTWFDDFQRLTTSARNAARFQDAFGDIDVRHRLAEVQCPTIVLHATRDQRIPVEQGRLVASEIPDARFIPLESRNHVLVDYEPAWQQSMDCIRSFLAEMPV